MMQENEVWVNPGTARRHGLVNGLYVRLRNQDGVVSNRIKVKITERIRPECVYMVHGFGHNSRMLKHAYLKGASDAQLITRYATDPLMGGTAMNINFVTFDAEEA
jgi:thiosulfate reductase/polysulfide reductase chain A